MLDQHPQFRNIVIGAGFSGKCGLWVGEWRRLIRQRGRGEGAGVLVGKVRSQGSIKSKGVSPTDHNWTYS